MKGGRPRKERKNRGKPGINSCHAVIDHIWQIKSPLLYNDLDSFTVTTANQPVHLSEDEYKCGICQNPLNNPIYTSCSRFTCATCLIRSIEVSQTTLCPSCDTSLPQMLRHQINRHHPSSCPSRNGNKLQGLWQLCALGGID